MKKKVSVKLKFFFRPNKTHWCWLGLCADIGFIPKRDEATVGTDETAGLNTPVCQELRT